MFDRPPHLEGLSGSDPLYVKSYDADVYDSIKLFKNLLIKFANQLEVSSRLDQSQLRKRANKLSRLVIPECKKLLEQLTALASLRELDSGQSTVDPVSLSRELCQLLRALPSNLAPDEYRTLGRLIVTAEEIFGGFEKFTNGKSYTQAHSSESPPTQEAIRPARKAIKAVSRAAALLPTEQRCRYQEEFEAELYGLAEAKVSARKQLSHALRIYGKAWSLRRALKLPPTTDEATP